MKRFINMMLAALIMTAGCTKPDMNQNGDDTDPVIPAPEKIGTYIFDGKEYPVHTAVYTEKGGTIMIRISPLQPESPQTTYAVIGINSALEGETIDVEKAWHNDDYYFRYEDPVKFYSEYRQLQSGSIYIKHVSQNSDMFEVQADIILPDGTDFRFEYDGELTSYSASATL